MRFIRKAMIGLAALAALPLAAQGPLPAPTAKKVETAGGTCPDGAESARLAQRR